MSTTAVSTRARSRVASTPSLNATSSVPPPSRLTGAQLQELEAELRRELDALERRLLSERYAEPTETHEADAQVVTESARRTNDIIVRRDEVAAALARLASDGYGTCSHCGERIAFGRLLVMPEATNCLRCSARS